MTQPEPPYLSPAVSGPDPAVEAELRRVARQIVQDASLADDVVQETWLTALRANGLAAPSGWLRQVARRVALAARRQERRRGEMERDAARAEAVEPTDERALDELRRSIERTLENTHGRIGDVMRLRYREGLKLREIAERLAVPLGTVKSDHAQGLRRFRRVLEEKERDRRPAALALGGLVERPARRGWAPLPAAPLAVAAAVVVTSAALLWFALFAGSGSAREAQSATDVARATGAPLAPATDGASLRVIAAPSVASAAPPSEKAPAAVDPPAPVSAAVEPDLVVRVTAEGAPLADVPVRAFGARMALLAEARTDAAGRVQFAALPREKLRTSSASGTASTVVVSAIEPTRATPHSVLAEVRRSADAPVPTVEVALGGPALEVRGSLVDELGAPVVGARVLVDPDTQNPVPAGPGRWLIRRVERGVSDVGGAFVLGRLEPGRRTLVVDAEGFRTLRASFEFPTSGVQTLTEPLVLERGAAVRGRVVDADGAPIAGAAIWSEREDNQPVRSFARSGPDGTFELLGLPGGAHVMWAVGGTLAAPCSASCELALVAGTTTPWDPALTSAGLGRLKIVAEGSAPLADVRVRLIPMEGPRKFVELLATDASGEVHVARDPGVPVRMTVIPASADSYLAAMPIGSFVVDGPWTGLRTFDVGSITGPRGRVEGRVAAVDGGPLAGESLLIVSRTHQFAIRVQIAADGEFAVDGLIAGDYELVASRGAEQHTLWRGPVSAESVVVGELRVPVEFSPAVTSANGSPGG